MNSDGNKSPTSFITFCSFGRDMEVLGKKIEGFDNPVCNSFQATVHIDQVCFEIDLEHYKDKENIANQLESGLEIILDYNEERQIPKQEIETTDKENLVHIHLDTISSLKLGKP